MSRASELSAEWVDMETALLNELYRFEAHISGTNYGWPQPILQSLWFAPLVLVTLTYLIGVCYSKIILLN